MEGRSEEWQERRRRGELGPRVSEESGAVFHEQLSELLTVELSREERMKCIIDVLYEGVLSEPDFSVAYAKVCHRLKGIKVPTAENPGVTVNFRKLLLNRCQKDFEKDKDDGVLEQMKKKLDAATEDEERQRLTEELEKAKENLHHRSLGNIKFLGELFKLKMLTEAIMHNCIVKLIKNRDEESLECLCTLLSTVAKNLDFEKAKPRMDQYFNSIEKVIKERKISSRIRLMLQEIVDLRRNNWVPRSSDQGPTTIDQDHKEAELMKNITVHVNLLSKKNSATDH